MKHTCEKRIYPTWSMNGHLHGVGAKYEHKGKWYCKRHHPPTVRAKDDEKSRKWREEWDAQDAARAKADAIRKAEQRVLAIAWRCDESFWGELSDAVRDLKALGWEPES